MYKMLKRLLCVKDAIAVALSKLPKAPPPLNIEDISVLNDYVKILAFFDEATISNNSIVLGQ